MVGCKKVVSVGGALVLSAAVAVPAVVRAELPIPSVPLWSSVPGPEQASTFTIDLDPALPGVEAITGNETCTVSATDGDGMISITRQLKIKVYAADGSQVVFAPKAGNTVTSGKFPDPRMKQFQCGGPTLTSYRTATDRGFFSTFKQGAIPFGPQSLNNGCPNAFWVNDVNDDLLCDEMPPGSAGVAVAKVGAERVVLVGQMVDMTYWNNIKNDDTNVSAYSLSAYRLNGTLRWTKQFSARDAYGYEYAGDRERVGDFLNDDGDDEIRLMAEGDKTKYYYLDPLTGKPLKTVLIGRP